MTEVASWHPHATWEGFTPNSDGSLAMLDAKGVQRVLGELASLVVGTVRVTGAERADDRGVLSLLRHAVREGIKVEVQLDHEVPKTKLDVFAEAGVSRLSVPIEGPDARTHDRYRSSPGEFEKTVRFLESVRSSRLALEVRTTLHGGLSDRAETMARAVERWSASQWLLQAPVKDVDASIEQELTSLVASTAEAPYSVVTQYAPFFLRLCDQRGGLRTRGARNERNGLCIRASGTITPDPAIPLTVGDVRHDHVSAVFDDHPLLRALRDPDAVEGKCGRCEFRAVCGGSRARALAQTGNLFASDPACTYGSESA